MDALLKGIYNAKPDSTEVYSDVAFGRVPVVGAVKIDITSIVSGKEIKIGLDYQK